MNELNRDANYKQMWKDDRHYEDCIEPSNPLLSQAHTYAEESRCIMGNGSDSGMSSACDSQSGQGQTESDQTNGETGISDIGMETPRRGYISMIMKEHRERQQHRLTSSWTGPVVEVPQEFKGNNKTSRSQSPALSCTSDYGSNITAQDLNNTGELHEDGELKLSGEASRPQGGCKSEKESTFIVINSKERSPKTADALSEAASCKAFTTFHAEVV